MEYGQAADHTHMFASAPWTLKCRIIVMQWHLDQITRTRIK